MLALEWRIVRRDGAVWLATGLFAVLAAASIANGLAWRSTQEVAHRAALEAEKREYAARRAEVVRFALNPPPPNDPAVPFLTDPRSAYVVAQAGRTLVLPLGPLSALSVGQFDLLPLREGVSLRTRQRTVADKYGLENPLSLLAGRFDLAFVLVWLLPLLVIALTYNLLSLEREQGTLALLRSQPVALAAVLGRKAALRAAVAVAPAIGLALVAAPLPGIDAAAASALGGWLLVTAAYAAFWLALALLVNSAGWSSTVNATALVGAWLVLLGVLPSALNVAVSVVRPVPSRLELLNAIREKSIDQRRDVRGLAIGFQAEHPELRAAVAVPGTLETGIAGTVTHLEQDKRTLPLEQRFDERLAAQQELVRTLGYLSPAILAQEAYNALAGTDLGRHRAFRQQAHAFREEWKAHFLPMIFTKLPMTASEYDRLPHFSFMDEPPAALAGRFGRSLAGLLVPALALGTWALYRLGAARGRRSSRAPEQAPGHTTRGAEETSS